MLRTNNSISFLVVLFLIFVAFPACKKDQTLHIDITRHQWELKSLRYENKTHPKPEGEFFRENAYILVFENDSTFRLNTNSNYMAISYAITAKGHFKVSGISSTRVGEGELATFNDQLRSILYRSETYKVSGNTLTIKGNGDSLEFTKK